MCGSDIHFWDEGHIGNRTIVSPTVMGHEASGIVIAKGEGVTDLNIGALTHTCISLVCVPLGDRVAMEPGVPCYHCHDCKTGRYNHCEFVKFGSTPPYDGYLTNYTIHPADLCYK